MSYKHTGLKKWIGLDRTLHAQFWFIILFHALYAALFVFKPSNHATLVAIDNTANAVGTIVMGIWVMARPLSRLLFHRQSIRHNAAQTYASLFLALGCFCYGAGTAIWTYNESIMHKTVLFPSWSDAAYVIEYPFLFLGVMLLPLGAIPKARLPQILLDGTMVMAGLVTFSWYFLLGPTLLQGADSVLAKVIGTAYPCFDLVLLFCLMMLSVHIHNVKMHPIIVSIFVGISCVVIGDTVFDYQSLHNTYHVGSFVDITWSLGYMLVAFGGSLVNRIHTEQIATTSSAPKAFGTNEVPVWQSLAPFGLVPLIACLLWFTRANNGDVALKQGVYCGSALLIGLVVLRQLFAILENRQLNRALRFAYTDLEAKNQYLLNLAITDGLTGLKNHRAFQEALEQECHRRDRYGDQLSLLMLDVDAFKRYNDTFGHPAGDEVLKKIGKILQGHARDTDFVARYGGEEFAVILPHTDEQAACIVAERIRETIANAAWQHRSITVSIGCASMSTQTISSPNFVSHADQALYHAKTSGRNRVSLYTDLTPNMVTPLLR